MNTILEELRRNRAVFAASAPDAAVAEGKALDSDPRPVKAQTEPPVVSREPLPVSPGVSEHRAPAFTLDYPGVNAGAGSPPKDLTAVGSIAFPQTREPRQPSAADPVDSLVRRLESEARLRPQLLGEEDTR